MFVFADDCLKLAVRRSQPGCRVGRYFWASDSGTTSPWTLPNRRARAGLTSGPSPPSLTALGPRVLPARPQATGAGWGRRIPLHGAVVLGCLAGSGVGVEGVRALVAGVWFADNARLLGLLWGPAASSARTARFDRCVLRRDGDITRVGAAKAITLLAHQINRDTERALRDGAFRWGS